MEEASVFHLTAAEVAAAAVAATALGRGKSIKEGGVRFC